MRTVPRVVQTLDATHQSRVSQLVAAALIAETTDAPKVIATMRWLALSLISNKEKLTVHACRELCMPKGSTVGALAARLLIAYASEVRNN